MKKKWLFFSFVLIATLFIFVTGVFFRGYIKTKIRKNMIRKLKKDSLTLADHFYHKPSSVPIDIVMPAVEKDLSVLVHAVHYARKNIKHPIQNIYIVSPENEKIQKICDELKCTFIDEKTVVPITLNKIDYFPLGQDRRGWLFQQLIKLNADQFCKSEHILALDTDTLMVKPQVFMIGDQTIFNCSEEYNPDYFSMYERLICEKPSSLISFVSHHMLFEKTKLDEFKSHIEKKHQMKWHEAIIHCLDKKNFSGFSEYESYANFVYRRYPKNTIFLHFQNKSLPRKKLDEFLEGKIYLDRSIKAVSFHHYS